MVMTLPRPLIEKLDTKRLIFTVTTGRSGTGYLAHLCQNYSGITSAHEPAPSFSEAMRPAIRDTSFAAEFLRLHKLPAIADTPNATYLETSHVFCKGFLEPLLELGLAPDLIALSRPARDVAASLYQLNTIPGRTEKGLQYCLSPDDPGVLPLTGWNHLHDYQLCFWYCLEIQRRQDEYERMITNLGGRVLRITLDDLTTAKGITTLWQFLGQSPYNPINWCRFLHQRSRPQNTKMNTKDKAAQLPPHMGELERQVHDLTGTYQGGVTSTDILSPTT